MTFDEIQADNSKMRSFVCEHLPADGTRIVLADGPEGGPSWADLMPIWDGQYGWGLLLETNDPEWVDLWEVYRHLRRQDMTLREWREEVSRELRRSGTFADPDARGQSRAASTATPARPMPFWDADLGRLWVGDVLIKQFTEAAENQRLVLKSFQELDWRHRIDDPLCRKPGEPTRKRQRRRRDTIAGLNDDHITPGVIRFRADGSGDGIIWDWCQ
jgi:hypothetical protein